MVGHISLQDSHLNSFHYPVIQVAKLSGFSPIIATASPHNASHLLSLGATHVIPRTADVKAEVSTISSAPIDIVYDAVGVTETQQTGWNLLSPRGQLILVHQPEVKQEGAHQDKEIVFVFGSAHDPAQRETGIGLFSVLTRWLEDGSIKVRTSILIPFPSATVMHVTDKSLQCCAA